MAITIDEAIYVSETCQYELSNQVGSKWCKAKYDAVTIAIDTMRKYQKITEIVKAWREVGLDYDSCDAMENIERVIDNEKID